MANKLLSGPDQITQVSEIKVLVWTVPIWHCAFAIRFASGAEVIYDPTGVQFAENWPLICDRQAYLARPEFTPLRLRERDLGCNVNLHPGTAMMLLPL